MNTYSIYNPSGIFEDYHLTCNLEQLDVNVPEGFGVIVGSYDHLRQCVDLSTGTVGDYQPPQPSINHAWDVETKTWLYVATDEDLAREARARRDQLLTATDWVTLRAYRTNTPVPPQYAIYQQALADIPTQAGFPRDIIWPTPLPNKEP